MADSSKDAQKYWWIKNKQIGIGWLDDVKDSDDQLYYSLVGVTRVKPITVHYKSKLSKISAIGDTLTNKLPSQFDEALISKAVAKGYELSQNPEVLQLAAYWDAKFESQLKRIQEWKNVDKSKTPKIIKANHPYAVR